MPDTIKLFGCIEKNISKDKKYENMPHLGVTEVVLVQCNVVKNNYQ